MDVSATNWVADSDWEMVTANSTNARGATDGVGVLDGEDPAVEDEDGVGVVERDGVGVISGGRPMGHCDPVADGVPVGATVWEADAVGSKLAPAVGADGVGVALLDDDREPEEERVPDWEADADIDDVVVPDPDPDEETVPVWEPEVVTLPLMDDDGETDGENDEVGVTVPVWLDDTVPVCDAVAVMDADVLPLDVPVPLPLPVPLCEPVDVMDAV
jgi:hypothetical protein